MPKGNIIGYTVADRADLSSISASLNNGESFVALKQRNWQMLSQTSVDSGRNIFDTSIGKFIGIPAAPNDIINSSITTYTLDSSTTSFSIDFNTMTKFIELTLASNIFLTLLNIRSNADYILKINFNRSTIKNLTDVIKFEASTFWTTFNTDLEYCIIRLRFNQGIQGDILFSKPTSSSATFTEGASGDLLFKANYWSNYLDSSSYAIVPTINGTPTIDSNSLLLDTAQLVYSHGTYTDLDEQDFELECFIKLRTADDYGSIFSIYNDTQKQLWLRVDSSNILTMSFYGFTGTTTLTANLTSTIGNYVHVVINRFNNIYRLFINGSLVSSAKTSNALNYSTANIVVGRLENAPLTGDVGATSFSGNIRELYLYNKARTPYNFTAISPRTP